MYVLGTLERWPVNIGLTFEAFVAMAALQRPGTTHTPLLHWVRRSGMNPSFNINEYHAKMRTDHELLKNQ